MGRDTIQLEDAVSTISEEYLLEFTSKYGIPESLHPELPGSEETIVDFPEDKVGVYTKFFEFANYRIPLSQFLFDILGHYQIHLSYAVIGKINAGYTLKSTAQAAEIKEHPYYLSRAADRRTFWGTCVNPNSSMTMTEVPDPTKVKTETRPYAAHEVPLLTVTTNHMIDMENTTVASGSSETPSAIEKSPLDFANEDPIPLITERYGEEE
ncbi:hypothetical protein Tco_0677495 [Tanacetum coccineum]|uniref:Uncharacterized protein n=1 Tax=Tanacetum coccineum TaxID=301880 RepID=A0ABQ4XCK4_9ASTR